MKASLGVFLAVLGLCAAEARADDIGAAAKTFKIGALELVALHDAQFVMPNDGKVFGLGLDPKLVTEALQTAGAPTDTITLSVDALLVKDAGKVILIDTGIGTKGGGKLIDSLKLAGVAPGDVTDILITHSHGDHIGGLLAADGQPAFPKATIRLSVPEWEAMKGRADVAELVKVIGPLVKAFAPGSQIFPSIKAVPIAGHTPGHTGYEITSGKARLLDIGDSAHSSILSLSHPEWVMQYDGDSKLAMASRQALLAQLAGSQEGVFSPHFPYPGVGTIKADGKGFVWNPTLKP